GAKTAKVSMVATRALAVAILTTIALPAAADGSAAMPDLSGAWGRNAFNLETPPSGPGPIRNLRRVGKDASRPTGGGGDPIPLVGDYMNPILKPRAAEIVKRMGEQSLGGHDILDPSNQCAPYTMVDRFGTPQSKAMHVVERYRLIDAEEARSAQERHEQTAGRVGGPT